MNPQSENFEIKKQVPYARKKQWFPILPTTRARKVSQGMSHHDVR